MSLQAVEHRIGEACVRAGRDRSDVTLVAVAKGQSVETIRALYDQGHRDFGENRAQELRDKVDELPADIRWHFVGPLQSNKVRVVRPAVFVLHSMDRESLAVAWLKGPGHPPPVYLQVNIGAEEQKSGVSRGDAPRFCGRLVSLGIDVVGLMAIPPLAEDPEAARPHFSSLRELRDEIAVEHGSVVGLSMGMTDDFEVAISEGATSIRVGRAIFAD
ncbi:MAG TPA: YggS family pyridoxal phosphate-dependent enzyme [Acidimicrobiia bacterium]|nr:YggS family pyridoxal phosphate-dependent enzyme [Acidimicrobiia bacterium]